MATDDIDTVLHRVAAGELTPEEALELIEGPGAAETSAETGESEGTAGIADVEHPAAEPVTVGAASTAGPLPSYGSPPPADDGPSGVQDGPSEGEGGPGPGPATVPAGQVVGIRAKIVYRKVEIIADSSVNEAFVSGPHTAQREGDLLVIQGSENPPFGTGSEAFSFSNLPKTVHWAKSLKNQEIVIRVNPMLPLELDVTGCSVRMSGGEAGARIRLVASSFKVDRLRGPLDLKALSSSVKGSIGPGHASRISAESSSVKVTLLSGTDVRIRAINRMGSIKLPNGVNSSGLDSQVIETNIGTGRDELALESVVSSIAIDADRQR